MNRNDYVFEMSAIANYLSDPGYSLNMKEEIVKEMGRAVTLIEDVKPGFQYKTLAEAINLKIQGAMSLSDLSEVISIAYTVGTQIQAYHRDIKF